MATSGSYDFNLTRNQIATQALRKVGAIAQGQTPNNDQLNEAFESLNVIIKNLQAHGIGLWKRRLTEYTAAQEIEPESDVIWIEKAYIRRNDEDTPLRLHGMEDYFDIVSKDDEGLSTDLYFDRSISDPMITLWPVPDSSTDTLYCYEYAKLEDFDSASDDPDAPPAWLRMLIFGLAYDLSFDYGLPPTERVMLRTEAAASMKELKGMDKDIETEKIIRSIY